jgi:hypothetical protein
MSSIYRFRRQLGGALLLSGMFASTAQAAPPAAPDVTVGADTKQLQFDWSIVQRSNYYELWFKANDGAPYVKFSESQPWRPRAVTSVSAHLLDWQQARYQVRACNPSGCGVSAPIAVADRLPDIARIKLNDADSIRRVRLSEIVTAEHHDLVGIDIVLTQNRLEQIEIARRATDDADAPADELLNLLNGL